MKYVGIDASLTGTGFAIKDTEKPEGQQFEYKTIKSKPEDFKDDTDRMIYLRDTILNSIPVGVEMVCIEDVFVGANPGSGLRLAMLAGCIRSGLRDKGIPFEVFPPSAIKKHMTGKGVAPKEVMMLQVYKKFGIEVEDNNQADAIAMSNLASTGYKLEKKEKAKKGKKETK